MVLNRPEETLKVALLSIEAYCLWLLFRLIGSFFTTGDYTLSLSLLAVIQLAALWVYAWQVSKRESVKPIRNLVLALNMLLSFTVPLLAGFEIHNVLGISLFGLAFTFRQFQVFNSPNSILFVLHSKQRTRQITVCFFIVCVWFRDIANFNDLALSIMTFALYDLMEAYWLNSYRWRQKEFEHIESKTDEVSFGQDLGAMERINRPIAMISALMALVSGCLALLMTKVPVLSFVFKIIGDIILFAIGQVARVIYLFLPSGQANRPFAGEYGQTTTPITDPSNYKVNGPPPDFQNAYNFMAVAVIIGLLFIAYVLVRKVLKNRKTGRAEERTPNLDTGKVKVLTSEQNQVKAAKKPVTDEQKLELIRQHYRKLLETLRKRGVGLEVGETPDQISQKLNLIYPEKWDLIEVITEGYCAQRYGSGPENLTEILKAFESLKEESK